MSSSFKKTPKTNIAKVSFWVLDPCDYFKDFYKVNNQSILAENNQKIKTIMTMMVSLIPVQNTGFQH